MNIIENKNLKEKMYIEKLENGLTVIIFPRHTTQKKYVMWGVNFGSIDNHFINPDNGEEIKIPDGVAHFLEHKMFEQKNGKNSLDTLSSLGVEANAYTTNDYTTYLFECTDNFYEALDELMDYVQNPYYTDENVEKEKGIIAQEINMYDDAPNWKVYMNAMECLYKNNPVRIDIAGTVESISGINKEMLYNCYNTFYTPSNMLMVVAGDFIPENLIEEIKSRIIKNDNKGKIKRIYPEEPEDINEKQKNQNMDVNNPLFVIAYKDTVLEDKIEQVKKHIAIEIILNILLGKSSDLYKQLYEDGLIITQLDLDYEFSKEYAHIVISGQSKNPEKIKEKINKKIKEAKQEGIKVEDFERIRKKVYGSYITEYNDVGDIARMIMSDYFKGVNSFEYIENYNKVSLEYLIKILNEIFNEKNQIISIVKGK